ncbi:MAG: DUF1772 domain-containing protein [Gammaproteobacteria bacterium]|nr:DUF1772 domain-containing protein [Gammaproteobacteria bacterium]
MLNQLHDVLLLAALLGCGVIAGVFFAFSTFVMKALMRLTSGEGIAAMQVINITVLNPWFLGVFLGTSVVCIVLLGVSLFLMNQSGAGYVIAGSAFYLFGCLLVTVVFNVPKNKALAKVDVFADDAEFIWRNHVDEWTKWNHIRTAASFLAAACFAIVI